MLKLNDIHTSYGPIKALKGISLEVKAGEIVCLIGSNGAGKTSALMTISGILRPESGELLFEGEEISGIPAHRIVGKGICQVPEGRRIFPRLTVLENLEMGRFGIRGQKTEDRGQTRKDFERVFTLFPLLKERLRQPGGTLSGGEQQMLAIGRALMSRPRLLLLDEPSLGLAPIMVSRIFKTISEINAEGMTVLLVEQNARAALRLSHRGYIIENGAVKMEGRGEDLLHHDEVKNAYLGE
ncbi:MAG: ABC transporter ATP-binding protein [Thermodesulfovibrionales bacterium]|jgi:branched-chain amino acid transport system ATP-binding protein